VFTFLPDLSNDQSSAPASHRRLISTEAVPDTDIPHASLVYLLLKLTELEHTVQSFNELYQAIPGSQRFMFLDAIQLLCRVLVNRTARCRLPIARSWLLLDTA